jgi:hypothetical protein
VFAKQQALRGEPELAMVVYNPATPAVAERILHHMASHPDG